RPERVAARLQRSEQHGDARQPERVDAAEDYRQYERDSHCRADALLRHHDRSVRGRFRERAAEPDGDVRPPLAHRPLMKTSPDPLLFGSNDNGAAVLGGGTATPFATTSLT